MQAATGQGADTFRVVMTIFGVDKSKGDVVAIVTVNNGEASRVKFLDIDTIQSNPDLRGGIVEYIATFPNLTIEAGDEYKACVTTVKDLELICKTGQNSPAARPEFVDLSLNASSSAADVQQVEVGQGADEDGEEEEVNGEDNVNAADEEEEEE
jgi:hypothetical protein